MTGTSQVESICAAYEGPIMTRTEHVAWAKQRALQLIDAGYVVEALASISSDFLKHPETRRHDGPQLGVRLFASGHVKDAQKMREFIEGLS